MAAGAACAGLDVHEHLEQAQAVPEGGFLPGREESLEILRARARSLARERTREEAGEEHIDVVAFMLAHETYGVESSCVREVCPLKDLTPVPCTPPFVLGIINVHGQILSVIDIRKFFELPCEALTDLNRVIILHSSEMEFGILADAVLGLRSIPAGDIQSSLPTLTDVRGDYLKGVTGDRVVVLDAKKILADSRIVVKEEMDGSSGLSGP